MSIFFDMLEDMYEVFMDDFFVFGSSFDVWLKNLNTVFTRCEEKNLLLNWEKCHFMVTSGLVLGHLVFRRGIEVDKAMIELISQFPVPRSMKDIHSFLGHAGFYWHFIQGFGNITKPLCALPFVWTNRVPTYFGDSKEIINNCSYHAISLVGFVAWAYDRCSWLCLKGCFGSKDRQKTFL